MSIKEQVFTKYTELQIKIKALEEEKKGLALKCLGELQKNEIQQMKNEFGTFSIMERRSWRYSKGVKIQEEIVKKLKKQEEESGKAKATTSESLRFQLAK